MKSSESLSNIAKALVLAQGEAKDIQKNKQGYGYKYATLESILSMLRPILVKNGLSIIQSHGNNESEITVTTRILHESGEWLEDTGGVEFQLLKGMNNAQSVGSAITYLRRYQISAFMNITSDEDVDGEIDVGQAKKNTQQPAETKPTLGAYLTKKGIKDKKGFMLVYKITNADQAQELLKDVGSLDAMVEEFKSRQMP